MRPNNHTMIANWSIPSVDSSPAPAPSASASLSNILFVRYSTHCSKVRLSSSCKSLPILTLSWQLPAGVKYVLYIRNGLFPRDSWERAGGGCGSRGVAELPSTGGKSSTGGEDDADAISNSVLKSSTSIQKDRSFSHRLSLRNCRNKRRRAGSLINFRSRAAFAGSAGSSFNGLTSGTLLAWKFGRSAALAIFE